MLQQLPRLLGVSLAIHAHYGTEEDYKDSKNEEYEWVDLPAMAGVAALTELKLVGAVSMPPDWRQLSSLQRLKMFHDFSAEELQQTAEDGTVREWCGFDWSDATLTALTALTRPQLDKLLPGGWAQGCPADSLHCIS